MRKHLINQIARRILSDQKARNNGTNENCTLSTPMESFPGEVESPTAAVKSSSTKVESPTAAVPNSPKVENPDEEHPGHLTLETYLKENYEFQYNLLTEQTEYRDAYTTPFQVLDLRKENTLYIQVQKAGIKCKGSQLLRYLNSSYIPTYHPFRAYLAAIPLWDHHDRLTDLAARVSSEVYWINHFHRWMLALTAQWMGIQHLHANSTAPILISEAQGWCKSTFCQSLMPPSLRAYYTDQMDIGQNLQEKKLAVMGLINLDEFDRLSPRNMARLKNLMQLNVLNLRKAYHQSYQPLPRIASFIGTSNRKDLLTDPTGSRRFICIEVEHPIDCNSIDHDQIYAQLKYELQHQTRYWFTHEEEAEIQEHNAAFYQISAEEELFQAHFRATGPEETGELLSLEEILETLHAHHRGLLRNFNISNFGKALVATGVERIHTRVGNRYRVVRTDQ